MLKNNPPFVSSDHCLQSALTNGLFPHSDQYTLENCSVSCHLETGLMGMEEEQI